MADIFIADTHLDIREPQRIAGFVTFLEYARSNYDKIYILGDLFNFWAGIAQARLAPVRPLIRAICKASRSGQLLFLHGNRDFLFSGALRKWGGRTIADGHILENYGARVTLYHGDALCTSDVRYQRMKALLQSRPIYYLSLFFPAGLCLKIGRKMRKISQQEIRRKDPRDMGLNQEQIHTVLQRNQADVLICGHVHRRSCNRISLGNKMVTVYVLPENLGKKFEYLVWHEDGFHFDRFVLKSHPI